MKDSKNYSSLGVSSAKEDIVQAAQAQGQGLFPGAFCKIIPDVLSQKPESCMALHADGAGTKSIVAYLAFRETQDPSIFASLAQDALIMNIDDLLCIGATGPFAVTNTIGRNRGLIPSEAIEAIISGYDQCARTLAEYGIDVVLCGGETADLGDLVRTLIVDASVVCTTTRDQVIDGSKVCPGDAIVGFASFGKAVYESEENSGIGSNGLTLARNVLLKNTYRTTYPEVSDPLIDEKLAYRGPYELSDQPQPLNMTISQALLSPTRTYAPVIAEILKDHRDAVHGIVHCTGGGQTKCLRLGTSVRFVKDNLMETPPIFEVIREAAGLDMKEMYQVFNMGHRLEIFVDPAVAEQVVTKAREKGVGAQIIGHCEPWESGPRLIIRNQSHTFSFSDT